MTITVRNATTEDANTIVAFNLAMAHESEARELSQETLRNGVAHILRESAEGFYLVAEVEGEVAGALLVTYEWSDWRNGRFWWIQSVYVLPRFRRRGVYASLHARVRESALADERACGIRLYVEKHNTNAQATYRHLGMEQTDYRLFEEVFV